LTLDLKELNCLNKDLDVGLDTLGSKLDMFLHKTYLLAGFICHLRKAYLSHMSSFSAEIGYADRSSIQESNKIEFALNELLQLKIFKSERPKINIERMRDFSLKVVISMLFLFLFFLPYMYRKLRMLAF